MNSFAETKKEKQELEEFVARKIKDLEGYNRELEEKSREEEEKAESARVEKERQGVDDARKGEEEKEEEAILVTVVEGEEDLHEQGRITGEQEL